MGFFSFYLKAYQLKANYLFSLSGNGGYLYSNAVLKLAFSFNDYNFFLNPMNQFEIISKIGEGAFACVYKVKRKEDGKIYALKKIKISNSNQREITNALNEVRILASIDNPYIVAYKEAFYEEMTGSLCMITEFAEGGDLSSFINSYRKRKQMIPEQEIWRLAIQMIHALKTLHKKNVFHRDIKSANIFLTKNFQEVKIGDMNVSILSKSGMATTQTGTPYYTSPEVWKDMPYNGKCDIWSLGCVLYEMCAQNPPFLANDLNSLKKKVIAGNYDRIPKIYSEDLEGFIRLCLTTNIFERMSAENLLHCSLIRKKIHLYPDEKFNQESYDKVVNNGKKLLETIRTPMNKNFKALQSRLPKSNYDNDSDNKENIMRNRSSVFKDEKSLEKNRSQSESKLPRIMSRKEIPQVKKTEKVSICCNIPKANLNHYR